MECTLPAGLSEVPMLVLFLHYYNNVSPGSILQQTNHAVMSYLWNVEEKGKKMPLFTYNTLLEQMVIIPSVFFISLCFRINLLSS